MFLILTSVVLGLFIIFTCLSLSDVSAISPSADILDGYLATLVNVAKTAISGCSGIADSSGLASKNFNQLESSSHLL